MILGIHLEFMNLFQLFSDFIQKLSVLIFCIHSCKFKIPKMLLSKHPSDDNSTSSGGKDKKRKRRFSGGDELIKNFLEIHNSCRAKDSTPRRYMSFLHTYITVYKNKKSGVEQKQKHLQVWFCWLWVLKFEPLGCVSVSDWLAMLER